MDNKRCHLKMIQDVIMRMNRSSFLLKGWCVTLVSAIIALAAKQNDGRFTLVALVPIVMFWILDGFFLWQENLFRALYDRVRDTAENSIDFSMDTSSFLARTHTWGQFVFSKTLNLFYLPLFISAWILIYVVK